MVSTNQTDCELAGGENKRWGEIDRSREIDDEVLLRPPFIMCVARVGTLFRKVVWLHSFRLSALTNNNHSRSSQRTIIPHGSIP